MRVRILIKTKMAGCFERKCSKKIFGGGG
jgi:hypothetical protein